MTDDKEVITTSAYPWGGYGGYGLRRSYLGGVYGGYPGAWGGAYTNAGYPGYGGYGGWGGYGRTYGAGYSYAPSYSYGGW